MIRLGTALREAMERFNALLGRGCRGRGGQQEAGAGASSIKTVDIPVDDVVVNIFHYVIICSLITNDMFMITRLPAR